MTTMPFPALPSSAAWSHQDARIGFEVAFFLTEDAGLLLTGCTTAVEDERAWIVSYRISLDPDWHTRNAQIRSRSASGEERSATLETDGADHWIVDGQPAPYLDGCQDVDLESSALTNAFPVHRLGLEIDDRAAAPAAYVRAVSLQVERLEQDYTRVRDDGPRQRYDYTAPAFDFACRLAYDDAGLVLAYPGIAIRAA